MEEQISLAQFILDVVVYLIHLPVAMIAGITCIVLCAISFITGADLMIAAKISLLISICNTVVFIFMYALDMVMLEGRVEDETKNY